MGEMKYSDIKDPNRGKYDVNGVYLGFIYKIRLYITKPAVRVRAYKGFKFEEVDNKNTFQHVITVITKESPESYFRLNRKILGYRFNTDPEKLKLANHDILAVSNKPYWLN
jgi:hypothetical protein